MSIRAPGVAVALVLLGGSGAGAAEATSQRVRALAQRAQSDADAVRQLTSIDSVDGAPVDIETALEGAADDELDVRLRTLADDPQVAGAGDPSTAREQARAVLEQGKFQESDLPRPFEGLLDAIGERLRPIGEWLGDLLNAVSGGRPDLALAVLVVLAALAAAWLARRLIARRAREAVNLRRGVEEAKRVGARELESRADSAERAGDLETALRLRFRAGLVRLTDAHAVPPRPSLTSGELKEVLRSRDFEEVAATFDEVVYGRRPARPEDLARSRAGWDAVLRAKALR